MLRHNLVADLCEYLGHPEAEVMRVMNGAAQRAADRWVSASPEERAAFYESQPDYVAELTHWHTQFPYRAQWTEQVLNFAQEMKLESAIDFGCGIATEGLSLSEAGLRVDLVDSNVETQRFVQWKIDHYGLSATMHSAGGAFDLGLLIDVIGHLPDPFPVVRDLADRCRYLFYTEDFNIGVPAYPMHQDKPAGFDAWWRAHWRPLAGNFWESRSRNLRVCLQPAVRDFRSDMGGVRRHVEGLEQHLPALGVEFVRDPREADIVHTQAITLPSPGSVAHVYTNHGVYPVGPPLPPAEAKQQEAIWENLCRADRVISVAHWPTKRYRERLGVDPAVIPNGVDVDPWDRVPRGASGIAPGYLLWAKPTINPICDPRPAQRLAERMPSERFVFTLAQAPFSANMTVTGALPFERMQRVLADCAVLVATTLEVFSVQTLEAMALGKPVLSLRHNGDGGNNEAVVHKVTGYLAEDEADLVKGAAYCLKYADRLGTAGRQRVEEFYGWPQIAQATKAVYLDALRAAQDRLARPRVSVVVPAWNAAETLAETIASVKAQTETSWECIIVDDGSTDDTLPSARKLTDGDPRFRVIHQENQGVTEARNAGLSESRGRYLCCLDSDDMFEPKAIQVLADFVDSSPSVWVAYPDLTAFGDQSGVWRMPEYSEDRLRQGNLMPYCSMIRRELWDRGIARFRVKPYMEDYEFWVNICKRGYRAQHVPIPLLRYRKRRGVGLSEATKHTHDEARARMVAMHPDFWRPRVSVVIPCWNQAQYLPAAIESVLAQTLQDFEIIVVDDGSPDDVVAALLPFDDPRVKLIRQTNKGLSGARNAGCSVALGEFLLTLDADDEIVSTFLDKTVSAMDANPGLGIIYTDIEHTALNPDGTRRVLRTSEMPEYDFEQLLQHNLFINTALQRRAVFETVGGYNPSMRHGWEDWDYAIAAGERGFCGGRLAEPLFRYLFKSEDQGSMIMASRHHRADMKRQLHANHEYVYGGGRPMGCCGSHGIVKQASKIAAQAQSLGGAQVGQLPLVEIAYVGQDPIPFSLRGPVTGATYRNISLAVPVRQFDPRDAEVLVATDPRFKLASDAVLAEVQ